VHAFVNELERPIGTYLYGRRMYETMVFWERPPDQADRPPFVQDFAEIWQAAEKIVYSKTLQTVTSAKTLIEREFDPEAIRQLKAQAGADLSVGGPGLAAQAIKAGLVDEYQLFLVPVVVGGGKCSLPGQSRRRTRRAARRSRRAPTRQSAHLPRRHLCGLNVAAMNCALESSVCPPLRSHSVGRLGDGSAQAR
jgi:dihydrofolate reductase